MTVFRYAIVAMLFFLMQAGTAIAVQEKGELKDIPLVWKPTDVISSYAAIDLSAFQKVTILIKPFIDLRKKPDEIGKNIEKRHDAPERTVTTKDNVAQWLTGRVAQTMRDFDVDVAKENGTVVLEADVVKFFVTESMVYEAEVGLKFRLIAKTGAVLWEGLVTAKAKQWGQSYKAENYYEGLSNATITVVHGLLKNDQFAQAVQKSK